ncbi:MAG: hypothetical protein KAJ96_00705 [Candidatus Thorarchaeota archaeon]|nr:hypothetical protein [Candidatus Thorarchaeota archaeon]
MISMRAKKLLAITFVAVFLMMAYSPIFARAQTIPGGPKNGPYIDKLVFRVIEEEAAAVLALQNDVIDMMGDMVDPQYLEILEEAANIDTARVQRNGFGFMTINTAKYPLNITALRRAMAFATDKVAISDDIWEGLADPQDGPLPAVNPWTIEGTLDYTYYEENIVLGNQLLDAAGFVIPEGETWRRAPDGSEFDINVECAISSDIAIQVGTKFAEALVSLHINGRSEPTAFDEYLTRLNNHGDYDMCFLGWNFGSFEPDVLGDEWWGENADVPFLNFANWRNDSYDAWRDQLMHSLDLDEIKEASDAMQRIWIYESPWIVAYNNVEIGAYRTDKFEGHQNDISGGVVGFWTNQKVHLKASEGGPFGGTFRWSNPKDVATFNILAASSAYTLNVIGLFYDSLFSSGPDGVRMNWLAESYLSETHADNPIIPEGHTRFTFNIIQNATWSDGMPLTAEDIAFSLNYIRDAPGNRYGPELADVSAAYAPTTYTVIVEFSTESYFHMTRVAGKPILPKHIFEDIGIDNWNTWQPTPPADPIVTSGTFYVSLYVEGEFVEMTRNPDFFYGVDRTTETTTTTTTTTTEVPPDFTMAIVAGAVGAAVVILVGGYVLMRQK